jgi:hypothetical protein
MADDLSARLAALEARVAALEAAGAEAGPDVPAPSGGDPFWALNYLRTQIPDDGAVMFAGRHRVPGSERPYEWQWGEPTEALLESDWSPLVPALSALAHPARLQLLKEVLAGTHAVADLQAGGSFGTTGQVYHHLRQLVTAGWLRTSGRGSYAVPPERVIPLLVILTAARR